MVAVVVVRGWKPWRRRAEVTLNDVRKRQPLRPHFRVTITEPADPSPTSGLPETETVHEGPWQSKTDAIHSSGLRASRMAAQAREMLVE